MSELFDPSKAEPFFDYAQERYGICLQRSEGMPAPWTDDPILQEFRFCNVFREDDKVTRWIKQHIRDPLSEQERWADLLWWLVIARFVNRIETLKDLTAYIDGTTWGWTLGRIVQRLRAIRESGAPLVTGAYMVKTPSGMDKIQGLERIFRAARPDCEHLALRAFDPEEGDLLLEAAHENIRGMYFVGSFMAYEIVCDLQHTPLLRDAVDKNTWAAAGPGAARGLSRIMHAGDPDLLRYTNKSDIPVLLKGMRQLHGLSERSDFWPAQYPCWDMRTVEHTLCEFDKYERTRLGEGRPKEKFRCG